MDVILIDKKDFKRLEEKVDQILDALSHKIKDEKVDPTDVWLDSSEVIDVLKLSIRTLQRFRSDGIIKYSFIGGRCWYQLSEIQRLLAERRMHYDPDTLKRIKRSYELTKKAEKLGIKEHSNTK